MKRTGCLLVFVLPLIFAAGCIDGQAALSINKDGSGKVAYEGIFDWPGYCAAMGLDCRTAEKFFFAELEKMLTDEEFETWNNVSWKLLGDGRYYFKGTAYFKDINKTDFLIGSVKSKLKIFLSFERADEPVLELKYSADDKTAKNQRTEPLPAALLETFRVNIVISSFADIKEAENFEQLDLRTAMFALVGGDLLGAGRPDRFGEYFKSKGVIKLVLASAGKNLFNYQSEVQRSRNAFEKTLKDIQASQAAQNADDWLNRDNQAAESNNVSGIHKTIAAEPAPKNDFNTQIRQGLAAESQGDFNEALKIYKNIANDANADEKYKAAASFQTGVCLLKMGDREKAEAQFEYVINKFPLQRAPAMKSVKMLRNIRAAEGGQRTRPQKSKRPPFVVGTFPELYSQDVDPNIRTIKIVFSEPMKKADWLYSSFKPVASLPAQPLLPKSAGLPSFDPCGLEWTLPVKLAPGKIYAISVNYGNIEGNMKGIAGFCSVSGLRGENFVLVFATVNEDDEPTPIDDEIIKECDKINFPQGGSSEPPDKSGG
ncbi:MAG: tetratricopeptide repeat protein [Sedimentisphaerales bacterium]